MRKAGFELEYAGLSLEAAATIVRHVFGGRHVAPRVPRFRELHRAVTNSHNLSDRVVDLAGEGFDCAVRVGDFPDSSLVSVRLADNRRMCVAALNSKNIDYVCASIAKVMTYSRAASASSGAATGSSPGRRRAPASSSC